MTTIGTPQLDSPLPDQPLTLAVTPHHRWVDLGLVMLIAVAPLVVSGVYRLAVPLIASSESTNFRFLTGLIHAAGALLLMACLLRRQGRSLKSIGFNFRWIDLPVGLGVVAAQWVGFVLVYMVLYRVHEFWTGTHLQLRSPHDIFGNPSILLWLPYLIAAPVFEETIVRAYMMTELIGLSWPVWLTALISTSVQTSYHLYYGLAGALSIGVTFLVSSIYFASPKGWCR